MPACTSCSFRMTMTRTKHNILFINSIDPAVWGGLENWMELAGLGLARRGHHVWMAGRRDSHFLRRVSAHPEITVLPVDIGGDFSPVSIRQIAGIVRTYGIDLTLCNFVKDVRLAGLARKLTGGSKIIWTPGVNLAKRSLSHKWLFAGFVDGVIVPSRHLRDAIVASGSIDPSRFEVIPVGIDAALWTEDRIDSRRFVRRQFRFPDDAIVCLTSGRFVIQKGHRYLLESARVLAERCDKLFFLLLGDGPLQDELQRQVGESGLRERVVFGGLLDYHQKAVFGSDIYVHPAIIEPYGIVLVEAMAAGLPVVATRVGGVPEVVCEGETAVLVDAAHPDQLTTAIEQLYTNSSMRESMGRAGLERFGRLFRMDTMIDAIETALDKATAG